MAFRLFSFALLASFVLALSGATPASAAPGVKVLGQATLPSKMDVNGTVLGGLSGIAFDRKRNVYYAVSDDRSEYSPARFYTLQMEVSASGIRDLKVTGVTTLDSDANAPGIQPYAKNDIDAESITLLANDELVIGSERDAQGRPWIRRFKLDGTLLGDIPLPDRFMPDGAGGSQTRGVRSNLGFEGLTLWPNGLTLFAMNEEALAQDGPIATQAEGTTVRLNRWDLGTDGWQPGPEGAYRTDPIFAAPNPAGSFADNGVSEILPARQYWPEFDLLVMERSFVTGVGNDVKLFGANFSRTTRTERREALPYPYDLQPADKRLIARMADLGVKADNLEGMTYGPRLPNGDPTLLIISDDNFSSVGSEQINQFVLLELLDTRPPEGTAVATEPAPQPAAPAPQPAAAPAAQPAAQPVRPPAPAQIPSALPRTGELPFDATLLAFGGALLALGARLRRR